MLNGDGLRTVLWVSGCTHHCKGCQNPVTWNPEDGLLFDIHTEVELFNKIKPDYISGVTFSGGDPLYPDNRETVLQLAKKIKEQFPTKTVWLYTGYLWEEICCYPGIENVDVIVDGKFIDRLKDANYHWAGSTNQRVIDVNKSLAANSIILH